MATSEHTSFPNRNLWTVVLIAVLIFSAWYLRRHIDVGWLPHDDGTYAQTADRVLQGELPHLDFDDPHSGGVAHLHAASFLMFGNSLLSLRLFLLLSFLCAVSAVYYLCCRITSPLLAALLTSTSVVWTLPLMPEPTPNWYSTICFLLGAACLNLFFRSRFTIWIFVAGMLGGVSILFKITGIYYLAGCFIALVYYEQTESCCEVKEKSSWWFSVLLSLVLLFAILASVLLINPQYYLMEIIHFVLPAALLCSCLLRFEWECIRGHSRPRFFAFSKIVLALGLGAALPILLFGLYYYLRDGLFALINGVFILPQKRLSGAALRLPDLEDILVVVPILAILLLPKKTQARNISIFLGLVIMALLGWIFYASNEIRVYRLVWVSLRALVPLLSVLCCWHIFKTSREPERGGEKPLTLFMLASLMSYTSLVQYPFSIPAYTLFVCPFTFLVLFYWVHQYYPDHRKIFLLPLCFLIVWPAYWGTYSHVTSLGRFRRPLGKIATLDLEKGGIRVTKKHKREYEKLIRSIQGSSGDSQYLLALPDSPEVYYLSGLKNPTRILFDFFQEPWTKEELQKLIKEKNINVVALRQQIEFSKNHIQKEVLEMLDKEFPYQRKIGNFRLLCKTPFNEETSE